MAGMKQEASSFATYPSLRDRVVLITGGGSGIGASAVEHFARQGAKVAFLDIAIEASVALVEELAPVCAHRPLFLACDVTETEALRAAIARVSEQMGPITVLVNNAASDDRHPFEQVTPAYWDERLALNLKHQFFAAQAVVEGMRAVGGGVILNMSSISWLIPTTDMMVYNIAKAGIVAMTRALARELGADGIRVNCVLPGAILTERQRRLWMSPAYQEEILARQCLKRNLMPEEVARLLLFLASGDSSGMTNQSYIVDGGWM